ncbi:MAG: (2Fe-2S)-binding protein [bacterium]
MAEPKTKQEISFTVNDKQRTVTVHPMKRLLDVLREDLELMGTKEGCGEGECGACSIWMNGDLVNSCMIPVCQAEGAQITTIEGLGDDERMTTVQEAFENRGGTQCGMCTPGMVMAATYYLEHPEHADNIREALAGNQCRCTGYKRIIDSVKEAFQNL